MTPHEFFTLALPKDYKVPTLTFCKVAPYRQRSNDLPNNATYKETFFNYVKNTSNWDPSFIKKILVITDPIRMNYVEANFERDGFRTVLADYTRFGICFSSDILDAIIRMGDGIQATYILNILFLMENPADHKVLLQYIIHNTLYSHIMGLFFQAQDGVFSIQISDHQEELGLTGSVATFEETGTITTMVKPGEAVIYKGLPEMHNYKTACDKDDFRLSHCLGKYLDKHLGDKCRMPWSRQASENTAPVCSDKVMYEKVMHLERLKIDGLRVLSNLTGCQLPCNRIFFRSTEVVRQTPYLVFPGK